MNIHQQNDNNGIMLIEKSFKYFDRIDYNNIDTSWKIHNVLLQKWYMYLSKNLIE